MGWERAGGFRIGKDKDRGSALGITMGIVTCPMEKGVEAERDCLKHLKHEVCLQNGRKLADERENKTEV